MLFSNAQRTPTKGQNRSGRSSTPRGDAPLTGRKPPVPRFGGGTGGRPSGTCSPHPSSSRQYKGSSENIQVAVRVRALLPREEGEEMVVRMKDKTCQLVMPNGEKKLFTYDNCFWSADQSAPESEFADQSYVYERIGSQLVDNAMRGFNSTIFAYGQTGSGKTYSLYGPDGSYNTDHEGLVPRVCKELFEQINNGQEGVTYKVQASMIEVYLENVYDLLNDKNRLLIRGSVDTGFYLPGVRKFDVNDYNAIQSLIKKGQAHRVTACTELNDQSSRAHTLFEVEVKQITADRTTTSKISLVDLAGSERVKDAKVEGIVLTQACHINKSLLNLGNCIEAIVERCKHPNKPISVPFRDSALTRLLKESLGGNARTILLVTISPSVESLAQTLAALRFADRAKQIKTHAVINEDALRQAKDLARMLQEQYKERLKHLNEEYQLEIKQAELKEKELELEREAARLLLERESLWSTTRTITELERRRLEERERELEKQYQAVLQTQQETAAQREELNSQAAKINSEQEERKREKQHEEELRILLQEQLNQLREDHESLLSETERKEFEFREKITVLEQQVQALTQQLEEKEAQRKREESHYKLITQSEIERIKVLEEMKNKKLKHEHEELNRELRDEAVEVEARLRNRIDELLKKNVELADALSQSQAKIHQLQNEQEALKASSAETQSLALRLHREEVNAIREEYESKITNIQSQLETNYNKEVQTLQETHSMEMASLRVQLDSAFHETMQTARETHQSERNRISVELETSWRNLETYKREAQDRLEKCDEAWRLKLENIEEQHQLKLTEMRKQLELAQETQAANTTHHNSELVQLRQEMEEQHTAQLRLCSQKHAEKVSELQQDMETHFHEQLKNEYKKHSMELTAVRNEMEQNAKSMLEDVTNKHNAQITLLKSEHEKRDEEIIKQFEEKIESLTTTHTQQLQMAEQKYKEEIERKEFSYLTQSTDWSRERDLLIQLHNTEKSQLNERLLQLEQMLCEKKMEIVEKNEAHRSVAELIAKCSTILNGKQCGRTRSLNSSRLSDISNKENEYYDSPSSSFIEEKLTSQLI